MCKQKISFPLNNAAFLEVISNSFNAFIQSGTSRSTQKLKPLHGAIAHDLSAKLGEEYEIKSQGFGNDREGTISGRYIDKKADIVIKKGDRIIGGIAIKFVMQNYSQNSNNYFENMLGETANIRCNGYPYFQIFIILDKLPYYKQDKTLSKWEEFSDHNVRKYITLSNDNTIRYYHTPNKTLVYVIHIPDNDKLGSVQEYMDYYKRLDFKIELSNHRYEQFGNAVILNDYEKFSDKVYHTILAL